MATLYTTKQGDTWDSIAKKYYKDELKADILMKNNEDLLSVFVFGAGSIVLVPDLEYQTDVDVPSWRSSS